MSYMGDLMYRHAIALGMISARTIHTIPTPKKIKKADARLETIRFTYQEQKRLAYESFISQIKKNPELNAYVSKHCKTVRDVLNLIGLEKYHD